MVGKLNRVEVRAHCQRKPLPPKAARSRTAGTCATPAAAPCRTSSKRAASSATAFASARPRPTSRWPTNLTDDELKLNSRVDVILLPDLVETPWQHADADDAEATAPRRRAAPQRAARRAARRRRSAEAARRAAQRRRGRRTSRHGPLLRAPVGMLDVLARSAPCRISDRNRTPRAHAPAVRARPRGGAANCCSAARSSSFGASPVISRAERS